MKEAERVREGLIQVLKDLVSSLESGARLVEVEISVDNGFGSGVVDFKIHVKYDSSNIKVEKIQ